MRSETSSIRVSLLGHRTPHDTAVRGQPDQNLTHISMYRQGETEVLQDSDIAF